MQLSKFKEEKPFLLTLTKKETFIVLICGTLSALSCATFSGTESTPTSLALSAIYVLLSIGMPLEHQLLLVALAMPNTKALGFYGISCSTCVSAVAVVKYFMGSRRMPTIPILVFAYLVYSLQFGIRFWDYVIGFVMPMKVFFSVLFLVCLAHSQSIARDSYTYGFKASIALMVGIMSAFWASTINIEEVGRMAVEGNDPNMLSVEIAFVLSVLCVNYYYKKNLSQLLFLILITILAVISLFCGSRMGLLLFALVLVTSVLLNCRAVGKSSLLIVVFGGAIVAFLMTSTGQDIIDLMLMRAENLERRDNISNDRFEIWTTYFNVMNSDPLLWFIGIGKYMEYGIQKQAHNALIEDIAYYGLIGTTILYVLYLRVFVRQYNHSLKYNRFANGLFYKIPFLVPLIGGLTLHSYTNIMNTTMLYLGVLCMTIPKKLKNKNF